MIELVMGRGGGGRAVAEHLLLPRSHPSPATPLAHSAAAAPLHLTLPPSACGAGALDQSREALLNNFGEFEIAA